MSYDPRKEARDTFGYLLASVMIPSRGRGRQLLESLDNIYSLASNPNLVEAVIKIDTDDTESYLPLIEDIKKITRGNYKLIISDRLDGYWTLQHAWNDLAVVAGGEFLFLWNDDVAIDTKDWDVILGLYKGKICIIQTLTNFGLGNFSFPIIHSSVCKQIGYLSPSPFNDNYIFDLAFFSDIMVKDHRLSVTHRGWTDLHCDDATHAEGSAISMAKGDKYYVHWRAYEAVVRSIIVPQNVSVIKEHKKNNPDLYVSDADHPVIQWDPGS